MQLILFFTRIITVTYSHQRCAGLTVPAAEQSEIDIRCIFHRLHKIITGRGTAVMTVDIKLHPGLELLFAEQGVDHADHFRTLLIHGQCIEVIHLNDFVRTDRVRHRTGILGKLRRAHNTDIIDPVNRTRAEVRTEFLITENGQSLFQAELEPVTAGDTVTGPVMEIFMTDNRFNPEIVFVCRRFILRQHIFGVKDVQPFVLHCAHIKEVDSHNHINIEVILETKALLVPFHGIFQGGHRPAGAIKVAFIDKQFQRHITAAAGDKGIAQHVKITGHQCEQIARFRERIFPFYPVFIPGFPGINPVTVG